MRRNWIHSDSIDYAVIEKTDRAAAVPLQTSWSSIWDVSEQDDEGNVTKGDVLMHNTRNSLFVAENRCVAAVGLDNVVVVVSGTARVTRGEDVFMLSENESTYIPIGTNHRLEDARFGIKLE